MTGDVKTFIDDFVAVLPRVFARDFTVFATTPDEVHNRLNWLVAPDTTNLAALDALVAKVHAMNIDHVVLCGMGGSSLYARTLVPYHTGARQVTVLDTTHPDTLRHVDATVNYPTTLFVFASKSGSTAETEAMRRYFTARMHAEVPDAPNRLAVITDPESSLAQDAAEQQISSLLLADPHVGGRFAAHTLFGVTVAALAGVDVKAHLDAARHAYAALSVASAQNVAIRLAAQLAAAVKRVGDVATVAVELRHLDATFGLWIEQLLAESLGKDGVGVHVVTGSTNATVDVHLAIEADPSVELPDLHEDGTTVTLTIPLGHEGVAMAAAVMMLATALAGRGIGVNPFDQPNVAAAKQATTKALASRQTLPAARDVADVLAHVSPSTALVILAYVAPDSPDEHALRRDAETLGRQRQATVTLGVGPRYLHSTGQLHKGALVDAVYFVIGPSFTADLAIPGDTSTFGALIAAQAAGDVAALTALGRQVHVITPQSLRAYVA